MILTLPCHHPLFNKQNIVQEGEAAGGGAVGGAGSCAFWNVSDASTTSAEIRSLREALQAAEEVGQSDEIFFFEVVILRFAC